MEKLCIMQFGCNASMENRLLNSCRNTYQIVRDVSEADWCIFPLCSITEKNITEAEGKLQVLFEHKKETCKVIVTGCITTVKESKKEFLKKYPIDYIVPMDEFQIDRICEILNVNVSDDIYNQYEVVAKVIIADGCLNHCAFCRIHYSKISLRSIPISIIEKQVQKITKRGIKFIQLRAMNITQYGIDLYGRKQLHILLKRLSQMEGLQGIELAGFSLSDIYDELLEEICNNSLITQIYTDIQSGSDRILNLMNVGHTVENIKRCFSKMRGKLTTTRVISGFPTETEEDVRQTIRLLRELDLDRWDVLRYVDSPDVPSGMLEKISEIQSEKHYHMYKKEILKNDQKFKSKIEGQKIEAYVSAKSLCYLIAYYPKKGVYIYLDMKPEYFDLNLNDKILVAFKNHKCFLEEVIEKGKIKTNKTNAVKRFNNQLSMILMHFDTMTSEYALPYEELSYIFNKIFYSYARDNCNEEIFQARIAHLPEALRNALIEAFKTR